MRPDKETEIQHEDFTLTVRGAVRGERPLLARRVADPDVMREVQIATAALLVEMAGSDEHVDEMERETALRLVRKAFRFSTEQASQIIEAANLLRDAMYSVEDFTSVLLGALPHEERKMLLAMVSRVMIADGIVSNSEQHFTHRLQKLLQLSESDERDAFQLAVLASKVGQIIETDFPRAT